MGDFFYVSFIFMVKRDMKKNVNESRPKGFYKPLWTKNDQILALYVSMYGDESLPITLDEVATKVIGTSPASLKKEAANFSALDGRPGLRREKDVAIQVEVFNEYGRLPKNEIQKICLDIIDEGLRNPNEYVKKYELGHLIGGKRDEVKAQRIELLRKMGVKNPEKYKLQSTRPKTPELVDEPELVGDTELSTDKQDVLNFLKGIYNKIKKTTKETEETTLGSIKGDIEFMMDYLREDLPLSETKIKKRRKVIIIKESQFKNIVDSFIN